MKKIKIKSKRLISALLAIVLVVSVLPLNMFSITSEASTNHSEAEAVAWIKARGDENWWKDVNGADGCQCVDLIMAYYEYLVGYRVSGNACDYLQSSKWPSGWYMDSTPAPGAIVIWDEYVYTGQWTTGQYGHVGLVYAVSGSNVYTVETNTGGTSGSGDAAAAKYRTRVNVNAKYLHPDFVADTTKPTISNVHISNVSSSAFTVNCTLDDNVGVTRVWLNIYGPGGNDGYSVDASSGNFSHTISTSKYGGSGLYSVHIYAFDAAGNETRYAINNIDVIDDNTKPTISSVNISNVSSSEFTLNCTLADNVGVTRVWLNIYGPNGNDGYSVNASSGNFSHTISISKYGGFGIYSIHIYAFDAAGNETRYAINNIYVNDEYTIIYNPNNGQNAPVEQTKAYGEEITLSLSEPTREGYTFLGWSTDANAAEAEYLLGDTYSVNADLTLYAVWKENTEEYFEIYGSLKTFGESADEVTVIFYKPGESEACGYTTLDAEAEEFCISGIEAGEYELVVSKENHVGRFYEISTENGNVNLDIVLNLVGDMNGDGKVNTVDVARANAHAKGVTELSGYEFYCVDINGDGKVNTLDVARMNAHSRGITSLW